MPKSSFHSDLKKEQALFPLLDSLYQKHLKKYRFERTHDKNNQLKGIDLFFFDKHTDATYAIDEKAQLDYINEDLPTFAFELCYQKEGKLKTGWLIDESKKTEFYSLITGIFGASGEYHFCKITLVNRKKMRALLKRKSLLTKGLLQNYHQLNHGKHKVGALCDKTEGYLYLSKNNKRECPLNLVLKLDWLIQEGVAKRLC